MNRIKIFQNQILPSVLPAPDSSLRASDFGLQTSVSGLLNCFQLNNTYL
jgi:hypothetical protein